MLSSDSSILEVTPQVLNAVISCHIDSWVRDSKETPTWFKKTSLTGPVLKCPHMSSQ